MSWLDVHVIEHGDLVQTATLIGTVNAEVSDTYYVLADAPFSRDEALAASCNGVSIPATLSSYSATRPNCRVRRQAVHYISPTQAHVTVTWQDPTDGTSSLGLLAQKARITSTTEKNQEAYLVDAEGSHVVNAAGEVFSNPPTRTLGIKIYTIRKFVNSATKSQIKAAWNTNNDHAITIDGDSWGVDELLLDDYNFNPVDGSTLWEAFITIKAKPGGWKDICLNVGYREAGADGKMAMIKKEWDADAGEWVACSTPWPLDADGHAKAYVAPYPPADELYFWPSVRSSWTGVPLS